MLETPPFARVGLEEFPFLRAQAGMDEKLERAGGEMFQRAHGSLQHGAVKQFGQRG